MDQEKIERAIKELKMYRNYYSDEVIGTLYMALEKQIKKPLKCGMCSCGALAGLGNYCQRCGQAIAWED